ncbi:DUF6185 family protein [Streptomyces sp. NPDC054933]
MGYEQRWQILIGVLVGWALTASARPRRSVLLAASLMAVVGGLAVALPSLFGLPAQLVPVEGPTASGIAVLLVGGGDAVADRPGPVGPTARV